jgi:hypothetical protein
MFAFEFSEAVKAAPTTAALDVLAKALWSALAAGMVDETTAALHSEAIEAHREALRMPSPSRTGRTPVAALRPATLFAKARQTMPPDRRKSIERRRRLAASGPMPPALAAHFTTAELAALRIVADEVRSRGVCSRTYEEIAARAGVCRASARNAIRRAARLGLLTIQERRRPGRKNLPNVLAVVSAEWRTWLRLAPLNAGGGTGGKSFGSTDIGFNHRQSLSASPAGLRQGREKGQQPPRHNQPTDLP